MDVITDYGTFLREAKTAVLELRDMEQQEQQLLKRLKQDQKQLEMDKKEVEDQISQTTKKRLGEITASYDKELSKGQDQLKKARSKREKAKNQGVKERIIDETSDLRDDNRRIRLQIKTIFQQNHVPGICDTNFYYALYFPRHFAGISASSLWNLLAVKKAQCDLSGGYLFCVYSGVWRCLCASGQ